MEALAIDGAGYPFPRSGDPDLATAPIGGGVMEVNLMTRKEPDPNAAQIVRWRAVTSFLPRFPEPERETIYITSDRSFAMWAYSEPEGAVGKALRMVIKRSGACWQGAQGYPITTSDVLQSLIRLAKGAQWRVADMSELTDLPPMSIKAVYCGVDAYALELMVDDWRQSLANHHGQRLAVTLHQLARETGYAWVHHPGTHDRLVSLPLGKAEVETLLARLASCASVRCMWTPINSAVSKPVVFCGGGGLVTARLDFTDPLHLLLIDRQVWENKRLTWVGSTLHLAQQDWERTTSQFRSMGGQLVETSQVPKSNRNTDAGSRWRANDSPRDDDLPEVVPPDPRRPTTPMLFAIETPKVATVLDERRLAAIRAETVSVSTLLGDIFVEDAEVAAPTVAKLSPSAAAHNGLDARHSALLAKLSTRDGWTATDFERLVREAGLMPSAARDVLNDWALDRYDEFVLEGDDPVVVNAHLTIQEA